MLIMIFSQRYCDRLFIPSYLLLVLFSILWVDWLVNYPQVFLEGLPCARLGLGGRWWLRVRERRGAIFRELSRMVNNSKQTKNIISNCTTCNPRWSNLQNPSIEVLFVLTPKRSGSHQVENCVSVSWKRVGDGGVHSSTGICKYPWGRKQSSQCLRHFFSVSLFQCLSKRYFQCLSSVRRITFF